MNSKGKLDYLRYFSLIRLSSGHKSLARFPSFFFFFLILLRPDIPVFHSNFKFFLVFAVFKFWIWISAFDVMQMDAYRILLLGARRRPLSSLSFPPNFCCLRCKGSRVCYPATDWAASFELWQFLLLAQNSDFLSVFAIFLIFTWLSLLDYRSRFIASVSDY